MCAHARTHTHSHIHIKLLWSNKASLSQLFLELFAFTWFDMHGS